MTDLLTTIARLRSKAERASVLPRDCFKPAFLEAMGVIEELLATKEALRQAVFEGGVRAGELTAKVIERERRLAIIRSEYGPREDWEVMEAACNLDKPLEEL